MNHKAIAGFIHFQPAAGTFPGEQVFRPHVTRELLEIRLLHRG